MMSRRQVFRLSRDALTRPHRHQSRLTGGFSSPSRQAEQSGPSHYRHDRAADRVPDCNVGGASEGQANTKTKAPQAADESPAANAVPARSVGAPPRTSTPRATAGGIDKAGRSPKAAVQSLGIRVSPGVWPDRAASRSVWPPSLSSHQRAAMGELITHFRPINLKWVRLEPSSYCRRDISAGAGR